MTTTGQDVIDVGQQHLGEDYFWRYDNHGTVSTAPVAGATWVLMTDSALANSSYEGPWDCAEFVTYCVYQAYGLKYGLIPATKGTSSRESRAGQWLTDATTLTSEFTEITLTEASDTAGAIIIAETGSHVALSMGNGIDILEANIDYNSSTNTYYSDRANDTDSTSHGATQGTADGVAVNSSLYDTNDSSSSTVGDDPPAGVDIGDVKIRSSFNWNSTNYRAFKINSVDYGSGGGAGDNGDTFADATLKTRASGSVATQRILSSSWHPTPERLRRTCRGSQQTWTCMHTTAIRSFLILLTSLRLLPSRLVSGLPLEKLITLRFIPMAQLRPTIRSM